MINAFHPDYIKTHHPELIKEGRVYSAKVVAGSAAGQKGKASRESVHGKSAHTITAFPKTKAKR